MILQILDFLLLHLVIPGFVLNKGNLYCLIAEIGLNALGTVLLKKYELAAPAGNVEGFGSTIMETIRASASPRW